VKAWPLKLRQMVVQGARAGRSSAALAGEFEVPLGTVKAWLHRDARLRAMQPTMQPAMQPVPAKEVARAMQPRMQPAKLATFRGITALDLPGRTREIQSLNFAKFKRGQYPPRSAGIPGYLQGAELVEALQAWCGKWKGAKK